VFFDLAKAFDTIDRDILLKKMYNYGIRGPMHSWFKSYLACRRQYVILNGTSSQMLNINYGVPQGSVLGPLLFLLYINDIGSIPDMETKPKIFADDTNIFNHSSNLSDLNIVCQKSIEKISDWVFANRLSINYDKTHYMLFCPAMYHTTTPSLQLSINNFVIEKVTSTKYLGVLIDENLDWKLHITELCQSLRKFVGIFYKLSLKLPLKILRMLYFSLIYSRVLYAIEVYANTYITYLHDLIILNNRLLRIIQHKPYNANTTDLYKLFNTLPVNKLFQFQLLIHAHTLNFRPSSLPSIFSLNYQLNKDIHSHDTRSSHDFHRISTPSTFSTKISSNQCAKLWNSLPITLKTEYSIHAFKGLLKNYLIIYDMKV